MRVVIILLILIAIPLWGPSSIYATTDPSDAGALRGLYRSLNSPSKLTKWKSNGGDPCGDSWKGVTCSGSKVTEIKLSGLGLSGSLQPQLSSLTSLANFDVSNNKFGNQIPNQLPPKLKKLNLAGCGFKGVIPYSMSQITSLKYLNLSHNQLQGPLNDMFQSLSSLSTMDLSDNKMNGKLPKSLTSLSKMTNMYLQNNQFTGPIDVLANLPLENLNVRNNKFSGWVPEQLKGIKLQKDGNKWTSGPAPPPPPGTPKATRPKRVQSSKSDSHSKVKKTPPADGGSKLDILDIVLTVIMISVWILALVLLISFIMKKRSSKKSEHVDLEKLQKEPFKPLTSQKLRGTETMSTSAAANNKAFEKSMSTSAAVNIKAFEKSMSTSAAVNIKASESAGYINPGPPLPLRPPPVDTHKSFDKDDMTKAPPVTRKVYTAPINCTSYSLADLKMATNNFVDRNIYMEDPLGCVYWGQFDEKVVAVKKIESSFVTNPEDFDGIVLGISQLQYPNITQLVGYCSKDGQYFLVYEYHTKGSLLDLLHENSESLDLEARLKIALGTAQALAYLHDVCSPSVPHKNLKSANILVDADLIPHLSECGLAHLYPKGDEAKNAKGYTAPEVLKHGEGEYSTKSDIYSFGVIMLELLSGRRAFDGSRPKSEQYLIRWAQPRLHDIEALENMADPGLGSGYSPKSLSRFADAIALCVQREPEFRPPISEVVETLIRLVQRANVSKAHRQT